MKRLAAIALSATAVLGLAACNDSDSGSDTSKTSKMMSTDMSSKGSEMKSSDPMSSQGSEMKTDMSSKASDMTSDMKSSDSMSTDNH